MTSKKYDLRMHGKYIHYAEQKHNGNKLTCSYSSMVKPSARCIWWSRTLKSLTRISTGTKCRSFFARIDIISFISILRSERGTANHSASSRSSLRISALPQKSSNNSQKFPMVATEQRYRAKYSHIYQRNERTIEGNTKSRKPEKSTLKLSRIWSNRWWEIIATFLLYFWFSRRWCRYVLQFHLQDQQKNTTQSSISKTKLRRTLATT